MFFFCAKACGFAKNAIVKIITERGFVRVDLCKIEPKAVVLLNLVVSDTNFLLKKNKIKSARRGQGKALFITLGTRLLQRWVAVFS